MTAFAQALAAGPEWKAVVAAVGDQLPERDQFKGGLGMVYATESLAAHFSDIVATLRERTGVPHWVGCVGLGVCGTKTEYHDEPAISVLIAPWSSDDFRILDSVTSADAVSPALASAWAKTHGPVFGMVHGDPSNHRLADIAEALPTAGEGYFVGGLTCLSDELVQVADQPAAGGLSGALLSVDVPVMVALSQGCSPVGPLHRVSGCERSIIATLDDRPALDVLKEDVGEVLAKDLNRIGGYIHVAMPVTGSDTGDYTVRNLVGIDPNGGMLAIGANIDIGDTIMFVRRDPSAAQEDFSSRLTDLKKRIGNQPVRGGLFVSCVARGANMFGESGQEVAVIRDILGEFPMTGFYANGEICGNRMYGYTGVLSVFL
ncbi:MAG: FIST C-terminal domain-containing protein [Rhodospirillaceae bacterium]|jgi:small ligand-binding sensory domain FIST|nr:FIST C-terminal domain-containing protein [Rhodospirillaceae bacterium]